MDAKKGGKDRQEAYIHLGDRWGSTVTVWGTGKTSEDALKNFKAVKEEMKEEIEKILKGENS